MSNKKDLSPFEKLDLANRQLAEQYRQEKIKNNPHALPTVADEENARRAAGFKILQETQLKREQLARERDDARRALRDRRF